MDTIVNSRVRASLVDDLSLLLRQSGDAMKDVPEYLLRVLQKNAWRDFETQLHEHVTYRADQFQEFVETPPLRGLGTTIPDLYQLVRRDPEAKLALSFAYVESLPEESRLLKHGGDRRSSSFIPASRTLKRAFEREAIWLVELSNQRPDLIAKIRAKELSERAALMEMGKIKNTKQVTLNSLSSAESLFEEVTPEFKERFRELLLQEVLDTE